MVFLVSCFPFCSVLVSFFFVFFFLIYHVLFSFSFGVCLVLVFFLCSFQSLVEEDAGVAFWSLFILE